MNRSVQRTFPVVKLAGKSGSVSFHPKLKKLLWRSFGTARIDLSDIFVADYEVVGGQLKILKPKNLTEEFKGLNLNPVWVGSQNKIVFASNAKSHDRLQLFVLDLDHFCLQKLRSSDDNEWMPATNSDGTWIVWVSRKLNSNTQNLNLSPWPKLSADCEKPSFKRRLKTSG